MPEVQELIPQPHGGALMPGTKPGENRGPWGRAGKPENRLRRELERALESENGIAAVVDTLVAVAALRRGLQWVATAMAYVAGWNSVAKDSMHPQWLGAVRVLFERLYGPVPKAHIHAAIETGVLRRKVREVVDLEPRDVTLEPPQPSESGGGAESPSVPS